MAVDGLQRRLDRGDCGVVGRLPDAETELGNGVAVIERDMRLVGHECLRS